MRGVRIQGGDVLVELATDRSGPVGCFCILLGFFLLLLNICLNKNCLRTVKLSVVGAALHLGARAVVGPLVPCSSLRVWGKMGRLGCFSCPHQLL